MLIRGPALNWYLSTFCGCFVLLQTGILLLCTCVLYMSCIHLLVSSVFSRSLPQVIRCVHNLLSKLMSLFPTEPASSNVASKHDELETLYACVSKVPTHVPTPYKKCNLISESINFCVTIV